MLLSSGFRVLLYSVVAVVFGCGGIEEFPEESRTPSTLEQAALDERPPPNGANGTRPSCFWAHGTQRALRSLGGAALDHGGGLLPRIPLSQVSQDCREVLRSAVECSLTQEQSVTDPETREVYTGWWGLAPSWLRGELDVDGRRYVTGCMVQRLNYYGMSVPILLEGSHPAITQRPAFGPQEFFEESTVFGDLFSSTTPLNGLLPAFQVFACWEDVLPETCGARGLPLLFEKRVCDDAPLCGLMTVGPCALSCVQNGPYWQCKPGLLSQWWTQTVRVKLETATCQ